MIHPKPHKVLYVLSSFPNLTSTFVAQEMTAIRQMDVDVQVAAVWGSDRTGTIHAIEKPFLDKIVTLPLYSLSIWILAVWQLIRRPRLLGLLLRLLIGHAVSIYSLMKVLAVIPKGLYLGHWARQQGIDHIHAHFLTTPATVALVASQVSDIPYTVTIHAFDIFCTKPKIVNGSIPLKLQYAAMNIVISQFNERYIQEKWPSVDAQFEVINNGLDIEFFTDAAPKEPAEKSTTHILTVGRLTEKKGHNYLIEAVGHLRQDQRDVELSIVGEGPQEHELRELVHQLKIEQHVRFLGRVTQEDILALYQECDMFALACAIGPDGDMDGLPTVLLEALATGVPAVSTQVSGVPELIKDKVTGLCVPPHDSTVFADAVAYLIDHPDEAQAMAQAGRKLVEERFDRRKNAGRLLTLWQSLYTDDDSA